MFRRSIFLGLMVLLGSVLVYMILGARKQEKRIVSPPAEIIRQSKPSPTRVLAPPDLQVTESAMEILPPPAVSGSVAEVSARHSVTLRNRGSGHYKAFMLRFNYLTSSGSGVESRSRQITLDLPAGGTVRLQDLLTEALPGKVRACSVSVTWADLAD
jgi:hypothetical protein